ncbi:MAG: autotransporter-associated beta strand repeat-containing protein [Planctomycetes bacterium]|nr:autotransporter-associated beta strand repeat-containing protein [Planctomycetota bacterium]
MARCLATLALITVLSVHLPAVERSWDGGAGTILWGDADNWNPNGPPSAGDTLVFPAVSTGTTTNNNLGGLSLASIRIATSSWLLVGSAVTITGSIIGTGSGGFPGSAIALPITLPAGSAVQITASNAGTLFGLTGVISGPGGLRKTGPGMIGLIRANDYDGATTVEAGMLVVAGDGQLGNNVVGTTVQSGAALILEGAYIHEPLTLNGSGAGGFGALSAYNRAGVDESSVSTGSITLVGTVMVTARSASAPSSADPSRLGIIGALGGSGRLVFDAINNRHGLVLGGNAVNIHSGGTEVRGGYLLLTKTDPVDIAIPGELTIGGGAGSPLVVVYQPHQIVDNAAISIAAGGGLLLDGGDERIGSLAGAGDVALLDHELTIGGIQSTTFSGRIRADWRDPSSLEAHTGGRLTKRGSGTFTWTGGAGSRFDGGIHVNDGVLRLDAIVPDLTILVLGGTFAGTGHVDRLIAWAGTVDPGPIGAIGTLHCAQFSLVGDDPRLRVDLGATTSDRIIVDAPGSADGAVDLGASLIPIAHGTLAPAGYLIIDNDGSDAVNGIFPGWSAAMSTTAGDGNDVRIIPVATARFTTAAATTAEGATATMTVALNRAITAEASVSWLPIGISATAGADFPATGGSLSFTAGGSLTQNVSLTITDDAMPEPAETLTVDLDTTSDGLAIAAPSRVLVTIPASDGGTGGGGGSGSGSGGGGGGGCGAGSAIAMMLVASVLLVQGLMGRRR